MKFKITINDNEYHADMVDCDLVNQIADMCPFEVTFKQHRNQSTSLNYQVRLMMMAVH